MNPMELLETTFALAGLMMLLMLSATLKKYLKSL